MASTDSLPIAKKNTAFRYYFTAYDPSGSPVTAFSSPDSEISKDGGAFTDCTNEATYVGHGQGYIDLTSTEMNADHVGFWFQCTEGTIGMPTSIAPAENTDIPVDAKAVSDKTGYSLTQAFPTNFSSFSIDASGRVDLAKIAGTSQTARDIGASVLLSSGTGTGQVSLSSGTVTVGTNNDKTGYSLTQSFPSNFSALAITAGGATTVGTNNDKTGYSLTQAFPTNFSSLAVTLGGAVTVGTNNDKTGYTASTVTDKTGYSLSQAFPTNFSSLAITAGGAITVGTNNDKTGYSLTQAFPTNFSSLAITAGGAITVGTNNDKTGYSLTQAFPTNFSVLSIDTDGRMDVSKIAGTSQTARDIGSSVLLSNGTGTGQVNLTSGAVTVSTNNDKTGYSVSTVTDKTGYSLTQAFPSNFSALSITAGGATTVGTNNDKTGYTVSTVSDKTGYSLTSSERTAIANEVEAQIIDDTDSEKVLTAITDKIASVNPSLSGLTLSAIGSQVRTELTTELGRIDAAVSSRLATTSYTAPLDASGTRSAVGLASANLDTQIASLATSSSLSTLSNKVGTPVGASIAADISAIPASTATSVWSSGTRTLSSFGTLVSDIWSYATRLLTAGTNIVLAKGTGITGLNDPSASAIRSEIDSNSTKLDVAISSRLASASYTAPLDAAGTRSAVGLSSANLDAQLGAIDDYVDTEVAAIKAKTDLIAAFPSNFSSLVVTAGGAVTVGTNNDKTGYSLTAAYDDAKTAAQAGESMALTTGERTTLAGVIKTEIGDLQISDEQINDIISGVIAVVSPEAIAAVIVEEIQGAGITSSNINAVVTTAVTSSINTALANVIIRPERTVLSVKPPAEVAKISRKSRE